MGSGGKSEGKIPVSKYSMAMHMGVCASSDDLELLRISIGEKEAWTGGIKSKAALLIRKLDLFGGIKKEGGVEGHVDWLPGDPSQVLPERLAGRFGRTSATMPGFRGLASLFFTGSPSSSAQSAWTTQKITRESVNIGTTVTVPLSEGSSLADVRITARTFIPDDGTSDSDDRYITTLLYASETTYFGTVVPPSYSVNYETGVITFLRAFSEEGPSSTPTIAIEYTVATPSTKGGFYWAANNPYLKTISARVRRPPKGLTPSLALIPLPDDSQERPQMAANPAHIVYESLTNREWGMGAPVGSMDVASYEAAAQTLYEEEFGLAMLWTRQSDIESFITEVIDHIQAAHFVNPATGLWTIKLLRGDYDINTLPIVSPDNATLTNYKRKLWGETANEVVVTYTDAETEAERTVTAQDSGAIAMQGALISTSRNYYAVRTEALALKLAERDLAAVAAPIATCDVVMDRTGWTLTPGSVVKLTWPEHGIEQMICRVHDVDYGSSDSGKIKLVLHEDIFSFDQSSFATTGGTLWTNPSANPTPLVRSLVQTAPAFLATRSRGLGSPADMVYPEAQSAIIVAANSAADISYTTYTTVIGTTGNITNESLGERSLMASGTLGSALVQEGTTVLTLPADYLGTAPRVNDFVLFPGASEAESELCIVSAIEEDTVTLWRGALDTTPKTWPISTRFYVILDNVTSIDATIRSVAETVSYRLLSRTSRGTLDYDDAPDVVGTLSERPYLPNRPSAVRVEGTRFGTVDAAGKTTLAVAWSNRNRLTEVLTAYQWNDATMTPEPGQTTTITTLDSAGNVISTIDGITGTEYTMPISAFGASTTGKIRVTSKVDGAESLQGHVIPIINIGA